MFRHDENAAPTHAQFALRVTVLGVIALVAFAAIFFRLWFLEVLSGEAYLREADTNRVREFAVPAPRGEILDKNGKVLVANRNSLALQVRPGELFEAKQDRNRELRRLAQVIDMPVRKVKREIREQTNLLPASPVTLMEKVDPELVFHLSERQDQFPGISAEQVSVRDYPNGSLGAHVLGYVGEITEDELKEPIYDGLNPGDRVGRAGIEYQYDRILRGRNGTQRVQVDSMGEPSGRELSVTPPVAGQNLVLTIDKKVQQAGEQALATYGAGLPGAAFVAMDVRDGSILGMGSHPTYEPSIFTPPVDAGAVKALYNEDDPTRPSLDKAIQGNYPTGSTFKIVTAIAALENDLITPSEFVDDPGVWDFAGIEWINAGRQVNGSVDMVTAMKVSSDIYFYKLGKELEEQTREGLQKAAQSMGFGAPTGLDLPGELPGVVPTPEWRNELFDEGLTDRAWSIGDNINFSVGQGDFLATPLQLATAYAALGNGGDIVRPHVAAESENANGAQQQVIEPAPGRSVDLPEGARETLMEGLRQAAMEPGGTSYGIFGGYPVAIAGKTGTAEKTNTEDQSWYASLAPADNPKYVVVTTFEQGGFGADTAAPAARDILNSLLKIGDRQIEEVGGTTPYE